MMSVENNQTILEGMEEGEVPEDYLFELIETELQVMLELDHPNIVDLHQVVYDNKFINIVTELVNGVTLTDLITPHMPENEDIVPINEEFCKILLYQCLLALNYLHS